MLQKGTLQREEKMKKRLTVICTLVLTAVIAAVNVIAAIPKLSTALDNISSQAVMIKSAVKGENVKFSAEDFTLALGSLPSQIKVTALPDRSEGTLLLGKTEIFEGQSVSANNFNLLHFDCVEGVAESSFEFTASSSYATKCIIKVTEKSNAAPTVSRAGSVCSTQTDIMCFGTMYGYDADGDELTFVVVSYPSKGILNVTDKSLGSFTYTPYEGVVGADSFSYRVRDEYGNYSDECNVNLEITERAVDVCLSDMDGHWAHNAALSAVADGSMEVISEKGKLYFDPDEVISREEYLKAVMTALGAGKLPDAVSVFADDDEIGEGFGGYVAAAYKLGIVKGEDVNGQLYFRPKDTITRAEASVILNRILGAEIEDAVPAFSDFGEIPVWAESDMRALSSVGILSGIGNNLFPLGTVTRAQAAQMIYAAKSLYE